VRADLCLRARAFSGPIASERGSRLSFLLRVSHRPAVHVAGKRANRHSCRSRIIRSDPSSTGRLAAETGDSERLDGHANRPCRRGRDQAAITLVCEAKADNPSPPIPLRRRTWTAFAELSARLDVASISP